MLEKIFNLINNKKESEESFNLKVFSLGNPGSKYEKTRHNAGRIVADLFFANNNNSSIQYLVPDTFMNETGKFIKKEIKYSNTNINNVIIFYDDIDLPFGEIKMSYARSSGGHNGVESIIKELGSKDFYRIRVGIGSKPHKDMLLQDYVLMKMSEDEISFLQNDIVKNKVKYCLDQIIGEIKSKNK